MLLHPIGNQDPIPFSQSCCQLWLKQKLHNMMFTILSCLIAALQDKVHWIERLSLAEKTVITTWEAYAKWQRSFTLKNDNKASFNECQEQSVESFMIPTRWKCHNTTEAPRVVQGAVGHGSMWNRGSLFPYFPADLYCVGKPGLHPLLKDAVQAGGLGTGALFSLPTPSSAVPTPSLISYPGGLGPTYLHWLIFTTSL